MSQQLTQEAPDDGKKRIPLLVAVFAKKENDFCR
jgi:hypothetical protein